VKSASTPSLRVDPELRQAAEAVLREGRSLSSFMEQSLRVQVTRHQVQYAFVARGLGSRDEAQRTGEYFDAASVHAELRGMLTKSSGRKAKR
jgi:predicted transcriptional regulator